MNKRIRELANEARIEVGQRIGYNDRDRDNAFEEVFAELLIKETTNVIIKGHKGHMNPALAYDSVKQHFGVEE